MPCGWLMRRSLGSRENSEELGMRSGGGEHVALLLYRLDFNSKIPFYIARRKCETDIVMFHVKHFFLYEK